MPKVYQVHFAMNWYIVNHTDEFCVTMKLHAGVVGCVISYSSKLLTVYTVMYIFFIMHRTTGFQLSIRGLLDHKY